MKNLYLDAEYTCWEEDPPIGMSRQVIQIGLIELDLDSMSFKRQGTYWIRPHRYTEVSAYCTKLTGITQKIIKEKGRPLTEVMNSIQNTFSITKSGVYTWGSESLLVTNLEEVGRLNPFRLINLAQEYHCFYGGAGGVSLTRALNKVGLAFEGKAHDAFIDAYNLARLHVRMIQHYRKRL